jgi:hypothetical protein
MRRPRAVGRMAHVTHIVSQFIFSYFNSGSVVTSQLPGMTVSF